MEEMKSKVISTVHIHFFVHEDTVLINTLQASIYALFISCL